MPYLPANLPFPEPAFDSRGFWDHCANRRLMFQACGECAKPRHPPTPLCPYCQSTEQTWIEAPKVGRVYSYTIVHHPSHDAVRDSLPYNVALIDFSDLPGVRLVSNVIDAGPDDLSVGLEVTLCWERHGETWLPRFRRHTGGTDR